MRASARLKARCISQIKNPDKKQAAAMSVVWQVAVEDRSEFLRLCGLDSGSGSPHTESESNG